MNKTWNILFEYKGGQPAVEGNPGYLISDWYIPPKYEDLKDELLYNKLMVFSLQQFEDIQEQATLKLSS